MLAMSLEFAKKDQVIAWDGQSVWKVDSETFGTNRIAQTSRENPVESLWNHVNQSYREMHDD